MFIILFVLFSQVFFRYHMLESPSESIIDSDRINAANGNSEDTRYLAYRPENISYMKIFKKIWHYGLSNAFVFLLTTSIYPAVSVLVESQNKGNGNKWNGQFPILIR